jgi:hypothetical protein
MELSKSVSALGLYKYNCDPPRNELFRRFHSAIAGLFQSCGIVLTHFGAEGPGYPDKLTKISGRAYDRMLKSDFADVTGVSLLANPPDSNSPAYDACANATINYVDVNRELLACVVINEAFVKLRSPEYDSLLRSLVELCRWDFGYGFSSNVEKQPDFHILGLDNGKLSAEEYKSLNTWYAAPAQVRTSFLRGVYAYNLLNENQLGAEVGDGVTLRQFAQSQPCGSLTRLAAYGLHLWQVPDDDVARLGKVLNGSPVLIS